MDQQNPPQTPHDRLFKEVFSNPENAASELQSLLPPATVKKLDWSTLKLEPGEYIDEHLKAKQSDLLFSIKLKNDPNRRVCVYVLYEHLSSHPRDRFFLLRVLVYMVRIWEQFLKLYPDAKYLPVIVPVVIYHGEGGWRVSPSFSSLFDMQPESEMSKYIPDFGYELENLQETGDKQLRERAVLAHVKAALWFLKSARNGTELLDQMEAWGEVLHQLVQSPTGVDAFMTLMRYYLHVANPQLERVRARLAKVLGPQTEENIMTLAQQLTEQGKAEGRAEGKAEGLLQGEAKGKAEGKASTLLTCLDARGWSVSSTERARILGCKDMSQLEQWVRRAVTVSTLSEVFGSN